MAKNILIFADGTGNEGGLLPDESRTNVYKLYRATRTGPDSIIDPGKQLAFYIPGIGTPTVRHDTRWDRTKEAVRQMFGLGLTKKIIDCYVAILGVWQPGDRIYLFGFSRGAYTVRCLSHVLEVCGVPPCLDALKCQFGNQELSQCGANVEVDSRVGILEWFTGVEFLVFHVFVERRIHCQTGSG
jgi:uncharacterized protein (DUF2235 family)